MVRKIVQDSVFVGKNETVSTIAASRTVYSAGSADGIPSIALAKESILGCPMKPSIFSFRHFLIMRN